MKRKYIKSLSIRVLVSLLIAISISFFYYIFLTPTIYGSYFIFKLLNYNVYVEGNLLYIGEVALRFIEACVAGSAYGLMAIFVTITKDIKLISRIKMVLLGFLMIFLINLIRIVLLIFIFYYYGLSLFNQVHMVMWLFVSSLAVALIWIFLIKMFDVKTIPVYSDILFLVKQIKK